MSIFDDIGNALIDAAETAAGAVETVVNVIEEVVADVVETIYGAIILGILAIAKLLGEIPFIGFFLEAILHWVANVLATVVNFWIVAWKAVLGIIGGVLAGLVRVIVGGLGGLFAWKGDTFVKGWGDIAASIAGGVLGVLAEYLSVIHSVLFMEWNRRQLTEGENEIVKRVFRGSIARFNIRIVEGFAGFYSVHGRPLTIGNTIYMKNVSTVTSPEVLVHECLHVWQYQNRGTRYLADALVAQAGDVSYNWELALSRGSANWDAFNNEAQGEFFENVYTSGSASASGPTGNGAFFSEEPLAPEVSFIFNAVDHTALARASTDRVRGDSSWRLSGLL
jgi:hypothetical protein